MLRLAAEVYPPLSSIQFSLLWQVSSISPLLFALSPPFLPDNHSPHTSTSPSSLIQPKHPSPSTSSGYSSSFPAGQFSPVHLFSVSQIHLFPLWPRLALVNYTGINWGLVASIVPMLLLLSFGGCALYINSLRKANAVKRATLLEKMGMPDSVLIHGTTTTPPYVSTKKTVVGFWHPYCNAGGGGERVLWVAVRYIQRQEPDTLVLVYSGDYPTASKEEIIGKVYERFSIELDPARLHFVPLKKRYLISDGYWKRFTLLGQSLGSLVLAFEGLCGEDGLWGDLFIGKFCASVFNEKNPTPNRFHGLCFHFPPRSPYRRFSDRNRLLHPLPNCQRGYGEACKRAHDGG